MGTQNTPHPDRQSSQPQMNQQQGQRKASQTSNASDPRQATRGRDVEEPKKPGDDIEQYASEDEDLDARDVTDEWDDSTDSQFASQRNAGSINQQSRSADSSLSKDPPLQGQQRSSSSSQRETSQKADSSQRDLSAEKGNFSNDRTGVRSSSSERSSSDKRH